MFSKGYRPSSDSGHVSAVIFARLFLKEGDVISFDRMRRKRHIAVYEQPLRYSNRARGFPQHSLPAAFRLSGGAGAEAGGHEV
jgi:hypothetical protein